MDAKVLLIF